MKHILGASLVIVMGLCQVESLFAEEKKVVSCPEVTPVDINGLKKDRFVKLGEHQWYMQDAFDLPDTLGNHIPLGLTVDEILNPKSVTLKTQLDPHTCQYNLVLSNDRTAEITFKLKGE